MARQNSCQEWSNYLNLLQKYQNPWLFQMKKEPGVTIAILIFSSRPIKFYLKKIFPRVFPAEAPV